MKGADLEIGAGELVGLVGENGSGKSTLMQIVVGFRVEDLSGGIRRRRSWKVNPYLPRMAAPLCGRTVPVWRTG